MSSPELLQQSYVLSTRSMLWMLLPLCLAVSIVYKTIRVHDLRRLWWEILSMFAYIACLLIALGIAAWAIVTYWP